MSQHHNKQFGELGEKYVCDKLIELGYKISTDNSTRYDIMLETGHAIEVKSATTSGRSDQEKGACRWQFLVRRRDKINRMDVLCLVCYDDVESDPAGVFVIPGVLVGEKQRKIDITNTDLAKYTGVWRKCLDRWATVGEVVAREPREPVKEETIPF